ncbi:MAG: YlxM family DNA-binding protein [Firmicutes bacterium]|nr:YlxM family DNA-binding protein [Bacillota bacterium]
MKDLLESGRLYDFYGALLTEDQQQILQMYYFEDLSLAEIAASRGTSRAAVHDLIRRSENKLRGYEERLHLVERFLHQEERFGRVGSLLERICRMEDQLPDGVKEILAEIEQETRSLRADV